MERNIRELGPKRFQIVYDLTPSGSGKRRQKRVVIRGTKTDAKKALVAAIAAVNRGEKAVDEKLTIADLFAECFSAWETRLAATTLARYRELYRHQIEPRLGAMRVAKLGVFAIEGAYAEWRQRGRCDGGALAERTVMHCHRLLSRALKQAVNWDLIRDNPATRVNAPKPKAAPMVVLDADDVRAFLEHCRSSKHRRSSKYRAMFAFLAWTGARRGEACALRWSDLDLAKGNVTISRSLAQPTRDQVIEKGTKGGRARAFAISDELVKILEAHRVEQIKRHRYDPAGYVFTERDGSRIPPEKVTGAFATLAKSFGRPDWHLHLLRHANASLLASAGVGIKAVSERLGHSTIAVTANTYMHVYGAQDRAAADALGKVLGPNL